MLNVSVPNIQLDTFHLLHDNPTVILGPYVEERDENTTPFYVTLSVHGKLLHKCMLESHSSHILIAKVIME